jgi:hypothetical protein
MNSQHRATTEQWAGQERWATPPNPDPYATCLLELRARVEALEAASSHRQHGEAAERAEPDPAASLVDRVASAIAKADDEGLTNMTWSYHSRAAIREVAAWLRSMYPQCQGCGTAWANLIEEEAPR